MPRAPVVPVFPANQPVPATAPVVPTYAGAGVPVKKPGPLFEVQSEESTVSWKWHLGAIGMLIVTIFTAYGNSFQSQWVLDNKYIIELDPRTKAVSWNQSNALDGTNANKPGVRDIFTQDYWWPKGISGLYRPLTTFSYWLNWTVFGNGHNRTVRQQVVGFHWVNLCIHCLNAILVYFLLLRLVKRFWVAFFTAALFAAHPISTESVTNIIGRADMLAATTIVGGLLLYIRATRSWGWRKVGWLTALMLLTEIGVFSKESSLVIGFVVALYDVIYRIKGRMAEFNWREFIQGIARCLVIIPLFYFAVKLYLYVLVPWMNPMSPGAFTMALIGVLVGLIGMFFATALLTLRNFWISSATMFGSAILLVVLGSLYTPGVVTAGESVPTLFQTQKPLLIGLAICAALFVAEEWFFFGLWTEEIESEKSLAKWQGFWDGYFVLLPVAIMMYVVRQWVFANATPAEEPFLDNPLRGLGFMAARLTAVKVWGILFWKLIWPVKLSCDYSFNQIPLFGYTGVTAWQNVQCVLWLILLLAIVGFGIWLGFKGQKAICFFIFLYLLNYIPTSNWPIIIGSIMAERFMYLPLIGFAGILVIGVDMVAKRIVGRMDDGDAIIAVGENAPPPPEPPKVMRFGMYRFVPHILLSVLVILYGVRAFYRNWDWRTDVTLWESALKTSPVSFRSYQSLAFALFEQDPPGNINRMIHIDEDGLKIVDPLADKDNSSRMYLHLGMYYAIKGELTCKPVENGQLEMTPEARDWFTKAIYVLERAVPVDRAFNVVNRNRDLKRGRKLDETNDVGLAPIYSYLGTDYMRLGLNDQAEQTFLYMRQLEPTDADSYFKMAQLKAATGHADQAAIACVQTILLNRDRTDAWQLLNTIYQQTNHYSQPCIIITSEGHAELNMDHPLVRENLSDAYRDFIRSFLRANRPQLAQSAYDTAVKQYKFPKELFDSLFQEKIVVPVPAAPVFYKPDTKVQFDPNTGALIMKTP